MRIGIPASGNTDPDPLRDPESEQIPFLLSYFFSVKGIKLITMSDVFFVVIYGLIVHVY